MLNATFWMIFKHFVTHNVFDRDLASLSRSYKWLSGGNVYSVSWFRRMGALYKFKLRLVAPLLSFVNIAERQCWDLTYNWVCTFVGLPLSTEIMIYERILCHDCKIAFESFDFKNHPWNVIWIAVLDLKSIFSLV